MSIDLGILVLRVLFGGAIAAHGAQKLFGWFGGYGIKGTGGFFDSIGFRPGTTFAALAGLSEFCGGALLILGLFTPLGAAAVVATMIVASVSVHLRNGFFATGNGIEVPFLYASAALGLAFTGGGAFSLDAVFGLKFATEPFVVTSQIGAVTVYADRAIVTRTAQLQLAAGQVELVFEKLPTSLVDQSLQVSGKGSANTTILDVNARTTFIQATANPRVKALEDEIETEQKQGRLLSDRVAVLKEQRTLLGKIETAVTTPPGKDSTAPRATFEEWQKLLTFADDTRSKLATETQTLDAQQKAHEERLNALNAQLNELHSHSEDGRSYKTVTLRVASAAAGTFDVALGYAVQGASWTPAYDARLHAEQRAVELTYFGIVRQRTGEDWKNVALTLSTARPSLGGGAPELSAWYLDVYQRRANREDVAAKSAPAASAPATADR